MKRFVRFSYLVLLVLVFAGCGQNAPVDSTPPAVVSSFPPDGYHGFAHGDVITLEFSEPVDLNSFLSAYRSTSDGLMPDQISYRFSDGGKKVTIYPGHDLDYSPDDNYRYYGFEIGRELTDLAGNPLTAPLTVTFTTLRTLSARLPGEAGLDGSATALSAVNDQTAIIVGDNTSDQPVRGFLSFAVPEDAVELIGGSLEITPGGYAGTPLADLGLFQIEWVDYGDALEASDFGLTPLSQAPIEDDGSSWQQNQPVRYDVGDWVQGAGQQGHAHLQFRLRFASDSDGDGTSDAMAFFASEASSVDASLRPGLELVYYGP